MIPSGQCSGGQAASWQPLAQVGPDPFKIGKYHLRARPVSDPDCLDRDCPPEDEAAVCEGIAAYFPVANGPTRRGGAAASADDREDVFQEAAGVVGRCRWRWWGSPILDAC